MKRQDFFRGSIFLLGFLLLNWVISGWFTAWTRASSNYEITAQQFEKVQGQVSVAILGDSHPLTGVMAGKIEGAYNLSSSGESYIFTYYKIKYYLERGNFHPEAAILQVDLHSFSSFRVNRIKSQDPAFWDKYLNYAAFGWETGKLMQMLPTIAEAKFGAAGGFDEAFSLLCCTDEEMPSKLIAGYQPRYGDFSTLSLKRQQIHAENRAEIHFYQSTYIDEVMLDYFYRLLDLLQSYDIKVVFVYYPATEYYYAAANEYIPVDSHLAIVEGLLADRQPALILDYHDVFFGHLEYFQNSDHLNVTGAEIFTQVLIEDLTEAGVLPVVLDEE